MFDKVYDIFIAYHGSYDAKGTKNIADRFFSFLSTRNPAIKIFYFPESGRDVYKANIIDVMKSRTFLLICNENISITENMRINTSEHYELSTEIDAFYALTQLGVHHKNGVSVQDSKILVCGDYYERRKQGQESELHQLFSKRSHYFHTLTNEAEIFERIYNWINERISITLKSQPWQNTQISAEVRDVYAKRSTMNQKCNLSNLVAKSRSIKAIGISNTELTVRMDIEAIKNALNEGAIFEIVFLDPEGEFTKRREIEEGLRPGRIRDITLNNIESALDIKKGLDDTQSNNFRLYKYDLSPRMNIILMDNCAVLQYYANFIAGMSNPCFFIEKQDVSPLYDFCSTSFDKLKEISEEIK